MGKLSKYWPLTVEGYRGLGEAVEAMHTSSRQMGKVNFILNSTHGDK